MMRSTDEGGGPPGTCSVLACPQRRLPSSELIGLGLHVYPFRHRVAPPGSTVRRAVDVSGARRYTNHGGGPADGALNSAVRATPVSSTRAGQPAAAHRSAMAETVGGSVTMRAVPSTTRSNSWAATLSVQRGSRARFLPFRVLAPVSNQNTPSTQRAPTAVT